MEPTGGRDGAAREDDPVAGAVADLDALAGGEKHHLVPVDNGVAPAVPTLPRSATSSRMTPRPFAAASPACRPLVSIERSPGRTHRRQPRLPSKKARVAGCTDRQELCQQPLPVVTDWG